MTGLLWFALLVISALSAFRIGWFTHSIAVMDAVFEPSLKEIDPKASDACERLDRHALMWKRFREIPKPLVIRDLKWSRPSRTDGGARNGA